MDRHVLWYDRPSTLAGLSRKESWDRALPIGNGRLGAMVFGDHPVERLQVNEESIWAGPPVPENQPQAREAIEEARALLFAGKHEEAEQIVQSQVLHPHTRPRSYQPFGDLYLRPLGDLAIEQYRRELNLDTAIAEVFYVQKGVRHKREVFSSAVDQVLVTHCESEQSGTLHTKIELSRDDQIHLSECRGDALLLEGQAQHEGTHLGVHFCGVVRVKTDGELQADKGSFIIRDASYITLYLAVRTDYNLANPYEPLQEDLVACCEKDLEQAMVKSYDKLKKDHMTAHQKLFRRVNLQLGTAEYEPYALHPTDQRLAAFRQGHDDHHLISLYFQYGRYLLISSSRPGGLPANLQGIWNEDMQAIWDSDFHLNINLQMNYWPAQLTNLAECQLPYFTLLENMIEHGKETARVVYGCRGFVAHYTTDAWLHTAPLGEIPYGMWPMSAGWCARDFMEYYRFNGDHAFLQAHAYPMLKEAATFFLDWLVQHPDTGEWVSGPSISPENRFYSTAGNAVALCMAPAMDQQIIWETFSNVLEAADVLEVEDEVFLQQVKDVQSKLALPEIGEDGRLMEWCESYEEVEPGHRHISHLYAVHPGNQYTFRTAPAMMDAAKKSLSYRLQHGGGHTGWSRAWMINFWARFKDGEQSYKHICHLLQQSTLDNLFDTHPPFQIDGNFGATAGVAEMLLQSHDGKIELLPALPRIWAEGAVHGLKARGGFEVAMTWEKGALTKSTVYSLHGGECRLSYQGQDIVLMTEARKQYDVIWTGNTLLLNK
ncbi:glycoside hydrolase family 95 protein [Bacillaceae bacterium SIJ1]|uniref:glycoside hydrolase family 95 protein n=1 Tax=Litoribacterium kuwaitense TaxID=1398745 RepID=UPI0013EDFF4F|nr:glycoside hydrolase family 95 protein [Litoribacterium kuwaitense]NGP45608.1 glycoside hydrolase family 95 protein [Litoribacterium kuwaitense]